MIEKIWHETLSKFGREKEKYDTELSFIKVKNIKFPNECKENVSNSNEEYNSTDADRSSYNQHDSECYVQIQLNLVVVDIQIVNQNYAWKYRYSI